MKADSTFMTTIVILILFNICYTVYYNNPFQLILGAFTGLLASAVAASVLAGTEIEILGNKISLQNYSVRVLFGVASLFSILFDIPIVSGFQIGLGLLSNFVWGDHIVFTINDGYGIGFFFITGLGIIALVSGIEMLIQGGS